jgi:hypothetical protein
MFCLCVLLACCREVVVGVYFDSVCCEFGDLHCRPNGIYKENVFFIVNILRMCTESADGILMFVMRLQEFFCS